MNSQPTTRLERLRWCILGLLFFSTIINYVDRQALSVLLPILRGELGLSSADYGTITTVFMLAYTVAQIPSGMWLDKVGTRVGFTVFVGLWSVAAILHAFTRGALSLGVFRCLLGFSEAGNWPAGGKTVSLWFPKERRAFAMAVFDSGSAVGAIVAPPIVALLALNFGWRAAFIVTGLLGLVWLAAWWWIYRDPPPIRGSPPRNATNWCGKAAGHGLQRHPSAVPGKKLSACAHFGVSSSHASSPLQSGGFMSSGCPTTSAKAVAFRSRKLGFSPGFLISRWTLGKCLAAPCPTA